MSAWKIVRLDNGNLFVAGGYGAFLAEVNASGTIVREIGAAPQPAGVNPYFYGMSQIMPSGDVVVANWEGHGAGHGNAGIALLEFNSTGTIVWQWNKSTIISSLQGVLVLDSLNTNLLYDDRNGVMVPLATTGVGGHIERTRRSSTSSASPRWRIKIQASASRGVSGRSVSLSGKSITQTATIKTAANSSTLGAGVSVYQDVPDEESNGPR